jgi:hypothetical protein
MTRAKASRDRGGVVVEPAADGIHLAIGVIHMISRACTAALGMNAAVDVDLVSL